MSDSSTISRDISDSGLTLNILNFLLIVRNFFRNQLVDTATDIPDYTMLPKPLESVANIIPSIPRIIGNIIWCISSLAKFLNDSPIRVT